MNGGLRLLTDQPCLCLTAAGCFVAQAAESAFSCGDQSFSADSSLQSLCFDLQKLLHVKIVESHFRSSQQGGVYKQNESFFFAVQLSGEDAAARL